MDSVPSRGDLVRTIAKASIEGHLGLFVGAGFTKGVLQTHKPITAYGWEELLETACGELQLDFGDFKAVGRSFPEIASEISTEYSVRQTPPTTPSEGQLRLKEAIARITTWYPSKEQRDQFGPFLENLSPQWIITTNYDLVVESLLVGKAISVGPDKALPSNRDLIPVYHLHGVKYDPQSIVLTSEDYVSLFRPNEYRQAKLATMIKEALTVFLGYGLGDINVQTAVDWSRNVYTDTEAVMDEQFVMVLYSESPTSEPYRDSNGMFVIETNDLGEFLAELNATWEREDARRRALQSILERFAAELRASPAEMVSWFVDDKERRDNLLSHLQSASPELLASFMTFFAACIDETWRRAEPDGAFEAYNEQLILILDMLETFPLREMPPALFEMLAVSLERLGSYIGSALGQSFSAQRTWDARRSTIPGDTVKELRNHAEQRSFLFTEGLLSGL